MNDIKENFETHPGIFDLSRKAKPLKNASL